MLQLTVDWLCYSIFGLDPASILSQSIDYFIYDSIKIIALLFLMIFVMGVIRTYLPQEKIRRYLEGRKWGSGNIMASLFGAITPFCSCSSIPIFMAFLRAGVPLGVTLSFLITSPIINEYLVVLMFAFFGWKITFAYVISGLLVGVISGMIIGKMKLEKYLEKDVFSHNTKSPKEAAYNSIKQRFRFGLNEAWSITTKLWVWVLVGVGVGAAIHNFVPEDAIHRILSMTGVFSVPISTLIGVPIYGSCAAIVPIAVALFQKGVPLGTTLAFLMAISALSLPEAIILRRVMKLKLIAIFFGIVTAAIIMTGYLFNFLQNVLV
ncbi:MAG: permease [Candidatus Woesearchaeota archaeon]|nr:permease [Candidatus Woesearchaeota archaeon]